MSSKKKKKKKPKKILKLVIENADDDDAKALLRELLEALNQHLPPEPDDEAEPETLDSDEFPTELDPDAAGKITAHVDQELADQTKTLKDIAAQHPKRTFRDRRAAREKFIATLTWLGSKGVSVLKAWAKFLISTHG